MLLFLLIPIIFAIWCLPGLYLARGMYSKQVREIARQDVVLVPKKPKRPEIKLSEQLHVTGRCQKFKSNTLSCNCAYREDWIKLRNAWIDYDEWEDNYGHIKNGVVSEPKIEMGKILWSVPAWPIVAGTMFIKGGADRIPDYRAIERMEAELPSNDIKELM